MFCKLFFGYAPDGGTSDTINFRYCWSQVLSVLLVSKDFIFLPCGEIKFSNLQKKISHLANFALQVFPGLLQCLPLKEDFEENHPVYSCIMELFSDQHPLIRQYLPQLLAVFSQVLPSGNLQDGK